MKRTILGLLLGFLSLLSPGCGPDAGYCDDCESGLVPAGPDGRARYIRGRCIVNGREVDCSTEAHVQCPSCRNK